MADFNLYIPVLKRFEGGWSDNPNDSGGATMCGVTLATYRKFFGQAKTKYDLRHISDFEWYDIMKSFWDKAGGVRIVNQSLAELVVDWYINAGANALKRTQKALGLKADGIVGPLTLSALNADATSAFAKVKSARQSYYMAIGKGKNSIFLRGWLNRTNYFTFKQ